MNEITNYITQEIDALNVNDTAEKAQDIFLNLPFTHFPVLEDGVYIGCTNSEDADLLDPKKKIGESRFNFDRFFVRNSMNWLDVLEVFAKNETNIVPVLDEKNTYLGYYEMEDIIRFFHETPFLREDGGVVVVEKGIRDYSMGEIAQIIESNNSKLLGAFISYSDINKVQITVKISLGGMNEIIQTFRRYNYEIISEHQEDAYLNNLRDRSDYLDKYLNI
ncbi:acetoin utilization protein acuB [Flavobacterium sp. SM15]|uniref:CBS domain-containing protein n=1 Tax=Flavobacterium sp. SM15 TaxID=2908005 RepID=UPI001ED9D4B9|nr:CBS domain-containing protein [Flavobacterium sp. SM15]MCG2610795.1 acetoin utilization protein acuB [Flavobacterium sp. SM15]